MRLKRNYFIFGCSFFFSLGANILGFSLIYRLTDRFFFNPGQVGSFVAMGQLFYFLGCNLYHRIGSVFSPIKVFPVAAVIVFAASIPVGFAQARPLVYATYWVLQISTGFFWPPVMAWLTGELNQKELNRELSIFNRSWNAASILGPFVSGTLYRWNSDANFILLIFSYFMVVALLVLMKLLTSDESIKGTVLPASPAVQKNTEIAPNEKRPVLSSADKKLDFFRYRGWIGAFSSTLVLGVLGNILPIHIRDGLGFTEQSAGMILFVRSIAGFIAFSILARYSAWHFNRRWSMILQGGLMLCACFFLLAGNKLAVFFLIVIVCGFLNSGCYNTSIFYSGATGKNPKKNMALHEICLALGNATGSAGGGFFYQHFRFTGTCLALFAFLGIGMGIHAFLNRKDAAIESGIIPSGRKGKA